MSAIQNQPELIVRMGSHAEKDYVVKLASFLDGLMVGANLFESTPGATASLLVAVKAKKTQVFIDPMTYAFGAYTDRDGRLRKDLDWIKSDQTKKDKQTGKKSTVRDFKRSYRALSVSLGEPLATAIEKSVAVSPGSLRNPAEKRSFCLRVLEYQRDRIATVFGEDEDLKNYMDEAPAVSAVFAPYFYIEPAESESWLTLNIELMKTSASLDVGIPVHGILCADVEHLADEGFKRQIVDIAKTSGLTGMWLWFSRFFEDDASESRIRAYAKLVKELSKHTEVHSLHGGFFSMTLSKVGMKGVSHGIGYGEQKDVKPVIGQSVPTVRYYLPVLAKRLGVPDIERAFDDLGITTVEDFYEKVCGCAVCRGVVVDRVSEFNAFGEMHFSRPGASRKAQTPAAAKRCRFHFLLARIQERNDLRATDVSKILSQWKESEETWGAQPSLNTHHLNKWRRILSEVSGVERYPLA